LKGSAGLCRWRRVIVDAGRSSLRVDVARAVAGCQVMRGGLARKASWGDGMTGGPCAEDLLTASCGDSRSMARVGDDDDLETFRHATTPHESSPGFELTRRSEQMTDARCVLWWSCRTVFDRETRDDLYAPITKAATICTRRTSEIPSSREGREASRSGQRRVGSSRVYESSRGQDEGFRRHLALCDAMRLG
jgi:hypothetical protein